MPAKFFIVLGFVLISLGTVGQLSAEIICEFFRSVARDTKRRNCWPEPFTAPDRAAARAPFAIQVSNGWRQQNMLGEFHFDQGSGQLNEAGRHKVQWIMNTCPQQHRAIFVHTAEKNEETVARMAAVQQLAMQIAPENIPPITQTSIADYGWPADEVGAISRKYQATLPTPRLPAQTATSIGGGGGSGSSGGSGQ